MSKDRTSCLYSILSFLDILLFLIEISKQKKPHNMHVTAASNGERAQMFVSTTSELGLDREVWAA